MVWCIRIWNLHAVLSFLLLVTVSSIRADVELPSLISDHMILQRGVPVSIWGTAEPGEQITVTFRRQRLSTTADANGYWRVQLDPMDAGGPFEMSITGRNTIVVKDVLVGEVWVCSGQSNMVWPVARSMNAQEEITAANYPQIRLFKVRNKMSEKPLEDVEGVWQVCSPQTVGGFSGVGYFFAREIHKALGVPVGMIQSAWGGTPAEAWTSHEALASDPQLRIILERWDKILANYPQALKRYEERLRKWREEAEKARSEGRRPPRRPRPPLGPNHPHRPSVLFNAMIAPLTHYTIRGVIWYQGESNVRRAYEYRRLFKTMIQDWRRAWGLGDFPFLFVQLANFLQVKPEPSESAWAELREAQLMALELPNTGMAVAIDIGEANDIHPRNKQDVGKRLALVARAIVYGEKITYSGPIYDRMKIEGNCIRIWFKHVNGGLVAKGGELKGFAIAGPNRKFVWATAKIEGDTVVVSSPQVPNPVAVRYAWADNPVCNLYNKAGLPASPFRTDDWPGITAPKEQKDKP